jgi:hypothetical protein
MLGPFDADEPVTDRAGETGCQARTIAASTFTRLALRLCCAVRVFEPSLTQASRRGGAQEIEQTVPQIMPSGSASGPAVVMTLTPVGSEAARDRKWSGPTP